MLNSEGSIPTGSEHQFHTSDYEALDIATPADDNEEVIATPRNGIILEEEEWVGISRAGDSGHQSQNSRGAGDGYSDDSNTGGSGFGDSDMGDSNADTEDFNMFNVEASDDEANDDEVSNDEASNDEASNDENTDAGTNDAEDNEMDRTDVVLGSLVCDLFSHFGPKTEIYKANDITRIQEQSQVRMSIHGCDCRT